MRNIWLKFPASEIWSNWPILGPFESLWRGGVIDNSNFHNIIGSLLNNRKVERSVVIMAVDLNTGELVIFDETTPN